MTERSVEVLFKIMPRRFWDDSPRRAGKFDGSGPTPQISYARNGPEREAPESSQCQEENERDNDSHTRGTAF